MTQNIREDFRYILESHYTYSDYVHNIMGVYYDGSYNVVYKTYWADKPVRAIHVYVPNTGSLPRKIRYSKTVVPKLLTDLIV